MRYILTIFWIVAIEDVFSNIPMPKLDYNAWWGPGNHNDTRIRTFKVVMDEEMKIDLKHRLNNHRPFTPPLQGAAFNYGFDTNELNKWIRYWADEYPVNSRVEYFNKYPQFKTNIQGLDIHFARVTPEVPEGKELVPILLIHGWPVSFVQFYEIIPILTSACKERDFVLEIIAPSLPGFVFSDAAIRPGLGAIEMAILLRNFMHRLGYEQFYVHGGDWGSIIGSYMVTIFPTEVLGLHTNMAYALTTQALALIIAGSANPSLVVEPSLADRLYPLTDTLFYYIQELGYFHEQATKPDTIGVSISDSPAGLLAYILQQYGMGTGKSYLNSTDANLNFYKPEMLLDHIMLYWSTNKITSSVRIYAETVNKKTLNTMLDQIPTPVPTWAIQAKNQLFYTPPLALKTKFTNLLNVTVLPDAGHFLVMRRPRTLAKDVLKSIEAFREWHTSRGE